MHALLMGCDPCMTLSSAWTVGVTSCSSDRCGPLKKSDENRRAWESKTNQKIRLATEKVKLKRGIGMQIEERKEIWHPNKRAPFRP